MSVKSLETLLRYAYLNDYNCTQWAAPARQCLQQSEQDLTKDLCDLLLKHFFSTARVHSILLDSYLTCALLGDPHTATTITQKRSFDDTKAMVNGKQFLSQLVSRNTRFATQREYNYHWSCILRLIPSLLLEVDADCKENMTWGPILTKLLVILSHIVSVGLYPRQKSRQQRAEYQQWDNYLNDSDSDSDDRANRQTQGDDLTASQQFHFSYTNNNTQMAADSQMTLDPDATFDLDATQPDPNSDKDDHKMDEDCGENIVATTEATITTGDPLSSSSGPLQPDTSSIDHQHPSQSSSLYPSTWNGSTITSTTQLGSNSLEWDNTLSAAKIIIDLIEKKGAKRIIENHIEEQRKDNADVDVEDPWVACHEILVTGDQKTPSTKLAASPLSSSFKTNTLTTSAQNVHIQKLLLLIERLMDRDLEQRLAVHMKYHELEDEGTARAMPSAGLMGMIYHMVQIRPSLDDDEVVDRLIKLQAIKGSFDESFYLDLWFAALTGLREASLCISCQRSSSKSNLAHDGDRSCNTTVVTNRLLWKNLVLVKLPHLISLLQERKGKEELAKYSLTQNLDRKALRNAHDSDAIESSLSELKTLTGLLNACSPSACCTEFYVPSSKSTKLVNRFASNTADRQNISSTVDDDDMMNLINNTGFPTGNNALPAISSIRSICEEDIFTSIVHSCRSYSLLTDNQVNTLLNASTTPQITRNMSIKLGRYDSDDNLFHNVGSKLRKQYSSFSLMDGDDDMIDADDLEQYSDSDEKVDPLAQVEENVRQCIKIIQSNITKASVSELIHIGLVSLTHWRKIVDFLLEILNESAQEGDLRRLFCLCDALNDCPSAIDLILQLYPPAVLLRPLETVCNEWNPSENYMDVDDVTGGNNNDPADDDDDDMDGIQSWYFKFGRIWIFVLLVTSKFDITWTIHNIFKDKRGLCYRFFVVGPVINGIDIHDPEIEKVVNRWLSAMGGDGISDDLLRTTKIQTLLQAVPTITDRLLSIHDAGRMEMEALTGVLSYFRKRFLHFLLVPGVTTILCDELLNRKGSTALACMTHLYLNQSFHITLIHLCGKQVLGSLRAWMECRQQYKRVHGDKINGHHHQRMVEGGNVDKEQLVKDLDQFFITKLDLDNEQLLSFTKAIPCSVTRQTLFDKSREMFRQIVKSGRSMYMCDLDGDNKTLWEPVADSKPPKQVISHFLDLVMIKAALNIGGPHWFIGMIVDEVLEAGKSGGAVRAAELGSCLLTIPLMYNTYGNNSCLSLLRCLVQDVVPSAITDRSRKAASFFQGQTLGVFVSDCLVLMYHKKNDAVDTLGCQFFGALIIDRVRGGDLSSQQWYPQTGNDGSKFSQWDDAVVASPVWRGFVKGLISNPFIKQMWPGAFES